MLTEALGVLERRCEGLEKENKTLKASAKLAPSTSGSGLDSLGANSPVKAHPSSQAGGSSSAASGATVSSVPDFANVDYGRLLEAQAEAERWRGLAVHRLAASLRPLPPLSFSHSQSTQVGDGDVDDDSIKYQKLHEKLEIARRVYFDARLVRASISVLDLTSKRQPTYIAAAQSSKTREKSRPSDKVIKSLDDYRRDLLLAAI